MDTIRKFNRTLHLEGSCLQKGDVKVRTPLRRLGQRWTVMEEKLDGAQAGVSFTASGELVLQSRGHRLSGGPREGQFDQFKRWANIHRQALWDALRGDQGILYGEWMAVKHTIFYDHLPHYYFEFDLWDRSREGYLSTAERRTWLAHAPLASVPVLYEGPMIERLPQLQALVHRAPLYRTHGWLDALRAAAQADGVDPERAVADTDDSPWMEGGYLKVEDRQQGLTLDRYKWVRHGFLQRILDSGTHWNERTPIYNRLRPGVSLEDTRTNAEFCASPDIGPCWTVDTCPALQKQPNAKAVRRARRGQP